MGDSFSCYFRLIYVIQLIEGNKIMNGFDHTVLEVPIEINTL